MSLTLSIIHVWLILALPCCWQFDKAENWDVSVNPREICHSREQRSLPLKYSPLAAKEKIQKKIQCCQSLTLDYDTKRYWFVSPSTLSSQRTINRPGSQKKQEKKKKKESKDKIMTESAFSYCTVDLLLHL